MDSYTDIAASFAAYYFESIVKNQEYSWVGIRYLPLWHSLALLVIHQAIARQCWLVCSESAA